MVTPTTRAAETELMETGEQRDALGRRRTPVARRVELLTAYRQSDSIRGGQVSPCPQPRLPSSKSGMEKPDPVARLAEVDALASNAAVRTHVWGLDLSGSMQGAGGVGGLLFTSSHLPPPNSAAYAAAFDGNGNVAGYVDMTSGAVAAKWEYSPFGQAILAEGPASGVLLFRFSTKFTDEETELLYYGLRYYSPGAGRWFNRDPIEEIAGANLYHFAFNSPLNFFDKDGRIVIAIPAGYWLGQAGGAAFTALIVWAISEMEKEEEEICPRVAIRQFDQVGCGWYGVYVCKDGYTGTNKAGVSPTRETVPRALPRSQIEPFSPR